MCLWAFIAQFLAGQWSFLFAMPSYHIIWNGMAQWVHIIILILTKKNIVCVFFCLLNWATMLGQIERERTIWNGWNCSSCSHYYYCYEIWKLLWSKQCLEQIELKSHLSENKQLLHFARKACRRNDCCELVQMIIIIRCISTLLCFEWYLIWPELRGNSNSTGNNRRDKWRCLQP